MHVTTSAMEIKIKSHFFPLRIERGREIRCNPTVFLDRRGSCNRDWTLKLMKIQWSCWLQPLRTPGQEEAALVLVAKWRLVWVTDIVSILKGNVAVEKVCYGVAVTRSDDRVCLEPVAAFVFLPGRESSSSDQMIVCECDQSIKGTYWDSVIGVLDNCIWRLNIQVGVCLTDWLNDLH